MFLHKFVVAYYVSKKKKYYKQKHRKFFFFFPSFIKSKNIFFHFSINFYQSMIWKIFLLKYLFVYSNAWITLIDALAD